VVHRWARAYGTLALDWLEPARGPHDLGRQVAPGLFEAELQHLHRREWARDADDVLWRRTKLGLHLEAAQRTAVADWLQRLPPPDKPLAPLERGAGCH
jgi:glycerol-3-phosphate dehydrogenase